MVAAIAFFLAAVDFLDAAAVVVVLLLVGVHVLRTIYCRFYTYYSGVLPYVSQQEERCKAARYEY